MGKYTQVMKDLPKLTEAKAEDDPNFQQKVDAVKLQIMNAGAEEHVFQMVRDVISELENYVADQAFERAESPRKSTMGATSLAYGFEAVRGALDVVEAKAKALGVARAAIEQMLSKAYEDEGVERIGTTHHNVDVNPQPYAQVEDREAFREWCIAEGLLPLMSLPWATTNKMLKDALLAGQKPPAGVKAFVKDGFTLRKKAAKS